MTILQVCAYAAPYEGNFIKSLKALGKAYEKKGYKMVYVFPDAARDMLWCKELEKHTDVYYLPLAKARIKFRTYALLKHIYKKYPDLKIINSHFELYDVPVALTAPKHIKVFWHLHDAIEVYKGFRYKLEHKVQYGYCNKNVKLLSVSEKHMKYVINNGFPKENAYFVPNGLDTDRIKPVSNSMDEKKYDFLIFGWEFKRKGVDLCIEALQLLNSNYRVAVVGSSDTERIIQSEYGIVNNLDVIEPVDDINALYSKSKCFLHISRGEGLSYALLEAIYAGLPVICSNIVENKFAEIFPTVLMVENENIAQIAKAMNTIIKCSGLPAEKIAESRKLIDEEYSISHWVENMQKYYGE